MRLVLAAAGLLLLAGCGSDSNSRAQFYARAVGPVLVVAISGGSGREELLRFTPGS
jgi:hypothetical protein